MDPREVIAAFDAYLAARALRFEAVVIGGTALNLLGVVRRTTRDCDVLHPAIPADVARAACQFASERRTSGDALQDARDLGDCVALAPTPEEISLIAPWLEEQDGNPDWREHVREVLQDLEGRLGRGV